jgi:membrane protease YdiL (CAAX protease family)
MTMSETAAGGLIRGPATYVPRTPWGPVQALAAGLLIVVLSAGVMLASGLLSRLAGPGAWRQDPGELAALGIWQVSTVLLTLVVSCMRGGRLAEVLALGVPTGGPLVYFRALLALARLQVLVSLVQYSWFQHDMYSDLRPFVRLFGDSWLLALLVVGVGAPLSEELLFRGFLLSALARSRLGFWGGAVLSTALWTSLHAGYSAVGIVEVFLIGLFFSWLLWRTGSLRVAIFCHALYNSLIVVVLRYVPLPG